uniref:Uncharacterized protein n=1 Tax=Rhizophora mucronata TaxID=61149 RepID=A0A2P2NR17_RHIMU
MSLDFNLRKAVCYLR